MRFISVLAAFAAALISVILLFGCFKENKAIETMDANFSSIQQQAGEYRKQAEELKAQLEELKTQKEAAQTKLQILQSREAYKTQPTAFFTFDEAFSRNMISIMELLDQEGIKGTFFVIGQTLESETMKQALKDAADHGHAIGIRSDVTKFSPIYTSEDAYFADLYACRDRIREITGKDAVLIRMPGGSATAQYYFKRNTGSDDVFKSVMQRLETEGFIVDDWNVNSTDAESSSVAAVVSTTLKGAERYVSAEYKTCLILFTDNSRALRALPEIIAGMKTQGYVFSALPEAYTITKQR